MYRPLRHFSLVSLVGFLLVALILGQLFRSVAQNHLLYLGERNNLALTRSLLNAVRPTLEGFLRDSYAMDREQLLAHPRLAHMGHAVANQIRGLAVAKVKIYNLDGVTIFSTEARQIGEDQAKNTGFLSAKNRRAASDLVFKEAFTSFDGLVENISVISSYFPVIDETNGQVEGVIELYRDVTPLLTRMDGLAWSVSAALVVALGILYIFLRGIVRRSQEEILRHEAARARQMAHIDQQNWALEERVMARTAELSEANLALQEEVDVRRRAETELRLAATAFNSSAEGIVVTDPNGNIQSVNPAFCTITGHDEVLGLNMNILKSGRHDRQFYKDMWSALLNTGSFRGEIWNRRKNGQLFPTWINVSAVRDEQGFIRNFVGVFSDVTAIKRSQEQLHYMANHDTLTGLPSRPLLIDRLRQAMAVAERFEQLVGVLYLDLDRFQQINEAHGHPVGDRILVDVAKRLSGILREGDTLSRVAGDGFVIAATGILRVQDISRVTEKILARLQEPFHINEHEVILTASIGVTIYPFDEGDAEALIKNAAAASNQARGRTGFQYFTQKMGELSNRRLTLESSLRHAIARDELLLFYQPQIDVQSGKLAGMEALIRWRHPEMGMISPAQFIPIAEESGLIIPIGDWVLRTACQQAMAWRELGYAPVRVAVNISARQFQSPGLVDTIAQVLADTGLDPHFLEVELTEGMVMEDVRSVIDTLNALRDMGIHIAIDDFGTGYSSLSYLKRFPLSCLKIDRAFVRDLATDPEDAAIIRAIIAMAKTLDFQVVAEGVASAEQLEFLRELHCDIVQGFLFSQPIPPEEATLFMEEEQLYRAARDSDYTPIVPLIGAADLPRLAGGAGSNVVTCEFGEGRPRPHQRPPATLEGIARL